MKQSPEPPTTDFVPYRMHRHAPITSRDDVLVYAAFCPDGVLTPLQAMCIHAYHAEGYRVVLVVNSGADDHGIDPGAAAADVLVVRENIGFDFGAWGHAARLIADLAAAHSVTFANDSLIGPLPGDGDGQLRMLIDETQGDAVFMTQSVQLRRHGQSYFFAFKKDALQKGALQVIQSSLYFSDKRRVVLNEELSLLSRLEERGIAIGVAFACPQAIEQGVNPTFFYWDYLASMGFPFVKVSLVPDGKVGIDDPQLAAVIGPSFLAALRTHLARRPVPAPVVLSAMPGVIRR